MSKQKNIHSVDFKVKAEGHGCVNFNGKIKYYSEDVGKTVDNVKTPKMLDFSSIKSISDDGKTILYYSAEESIEKNKNAQIFISENCLRNWIFKEGFPNHVSILTKDHAFDLLSSPFGLIRGFAIADKNPLKRKSCLFLEKAIDDNRKLICETRTTTKESGNTSLHTVISTGNTKYEFFGSINIEDLQFISTDNIFGRASILSTSDNLKELALKITKNISNIAKELDLNLNPITEYGFWKKKGRVISEGEWGILLNQDAIHVLVEWTIDKIKNLYIHQAKSLMKVESVLCDYNFGNHFRIKRDITASSSFKDRDYEIYYEKTNPTHEQLVEEPEKEKSSKRSKKSTNKED
jgi:hypothetical protein